MASIIEKDFASGSMFLNYWLLYSVSQHCLSMNKFNALSSPLSFIVFGYSWGLGWALKTTQYKRHMVQRFFLLEHFSASLHNLFIGERVSHKFSDKSWAEQWHF